MNEFPLWWRWLVTATTTWNHLTPEEAKASKGMEIGRTEPRWYLSGGDWRSHNTGCGPPLLALDAVWTLADQRQEFAARLFFITEAAQHRTGNGCGVLLFDAAHHHAEMARFNHHSHALRLDYLLDGLGNLRCQALLNLQAARE